MINFSDPESVTLLFSIIGGFCTFISLIWIKVIKPIIKLIKSQESATKSLDTIKKELTTNGGNSLKDAVIELRTTCNRMETRQKIIEQRTKAALHYNNTPLFETDSQGRLIWTNNSFYELTSNTISDVDGYDWLTYIDENDREDFLSEFNSCLGMNRKFVKITKSCDGKQIKIVGFPYKISDNLHGGFLVNISEIKET